MPFPLDHYIEASHVDYKERLEEKKPRSWLKSVVGICQYRGRTPDFWRKKRAARGRRIGKSAGCGKQIDGTYQSPH